MAKFISFIFLFFISFVGWTQGNDTTWIMVDDLAIKVNALSYNFGTIQQHDNAKFEFQLLNTEDEPLVIKHVTTSCNCTSPSFTKKPIKKGKKASVKIKYDSGNTGAFNKSVFVYTNKRENPIKLSITGKVKSVAPTEDKSTKGVSKITPKMENKVPNSNN